MKGNFFTFIENMGSFKISIILNWFSWRLNQKNLFNFFSRLTRLLVEHTYNNPVVVFRLIYLVHFKIPEISLCWRNCSACLLQVQLHLCFHFSELTEHKTIFRCKKFSVETHSIEKLSKSLVKCFTCEVWMLDPAKFVREKTSFPWFLGSQDVSRDFSLTQLTSVM